MTHTVIVPGFSFTLPDPAGGRYVPPGPGFLGPENTERPFFRSEQEAKDYIACTHHLKDMDARVVKATLTFKVVDRKKQ